MGRRNPRASTNPDVYPLDATARILLHWAVKDSIERLRPVVDVLTDEWLATEIERQLASATNPRARPKGPAAKQKHPAVEYHYTTVVDKRPPGLDVNPPDGKETPWLWLREGQ